MKWCGESAVNKLMKCECFQCECYYEEINSPNIFF